MPFAVYVLGLAIFAQGTSEFMLSGLLPSLAADLNVSVPDAGLLISAFAVGMLVGAPLLAVATLNWPRRTALVAFQAVFIAGHVVGALAPGYWTLLVTRVVTAVAYAGFWAVTAVTALSLVSPDRKARALAVVTGGLSMATVIGVPAGTLLAQQAGWRSAFWAIAVLTGLSMATVLAFLPGGRQQGEAKPSVRRELQVLAQPRLWVAYGTTALSCGTIIVSFSYLAVLLTEVSGVSADWVPAVLSLFGIGALAGLAIGGWTSDRRPFATLYLGLAGAVIVSVAMATLSSSPVAAIVLAFFLGLTGFVTNPAVNVRVFTIASAAPTLAGSTNVSAFNVGITIAPALGGLAIGAGLGVASVAWVGAAIGVLALGAALLDSTLHRRATATVEPAPELATV